MEYGQHNELVAEHHLFNNGTDYGNTFSSELKIPFYVTG